MDQLAADGVILNNYYVHPMCTPTRGALMSGRYQIHTGLQHSIIQPCQPNSLPEDVPTIANAMSDAGYATYMVGKWHVGFYKKEVAPYHRGFDSFFGFLNGGVGYYNWRACVINSTGGIQSQDQYEHQEDLMGNFYDATEEDLDGYLCAWDLRDGDEVVQEYEGQYSTTLFTQKAIDIFKSHSEMDEPQPFFLYLAYQSVHSPLASPDSYVEPYKDSIPDEDRQVYAGMTTCMDEGIGNLTKALQDYGLWDNTVLVFSSDNGGSPGSGACNWPLRGEKKALFEGGIKANGFVASPLIQTPGTVNNGLMHVSDWFPTFIGLAGVDASEYELDGFDLWQSISNGDPSPRTELLHNIDPMTVSGTNLDISDFDNTIQAAIRVGDWKLITGNPGTGTWTAPPEDSDLESIADPDPSDKNIWLFNIADDPNETTDLFDDNQDQAIDMLNKLAEYQANAFGPTYPDIDLNCNPANFDDVWTWWQ